jgi:hypothetical protein
MESGSSGLDSPCLAEDIAQRRCCLRREDVSVKMRIDRNKLAGDRMVLFKGYSRPLLAFPDDWRIFTVHEGSGLG